MYDSAYLNYCNRFPPNEIAQSVEKKKSIWSKHRGFKVLSRTCKKKECLKKKMFLRYHQKFQGRHFVQLCI